MPTAEVQRSLHSLIEGDSDLLENDSSEWAIAHRIAVYLETEFPTWNVDCELNRQGSNGDIKRQSDGHRVRPDISVHQRTLPDLASNLLVVELKKADVESDFAKLIDFTSPPAERRTFQYQYRLSIELGDPPNLIWFANGERIPQP